MNDLQPIVADANRSDEIFKQPARTEQALSPWEVDEIRLAERLRHVAALWNQEGGSLDDGGGGSSEEAWPSGTIDYDKAVGVDACLFAADPAARCRRLSRPVDSTAGVATVRSGVDNGSGRAPLALLLTGQLRTAEVTLPMLEANLVLASAPAAVDVFAHVWADAAATINPGLSIHSESRSNSSASARALAVLARFPGLRALEAEAEDDFAAVVTRYYDERYGKGWTKRHQQVSSRRAVGFWASDGAFLSQWYAPPQS